MPAALLGSEMRVVGGSLNLDSKHSVCVLTRLPCDFGRLCFIKYKGCGLEIFLQVAVSA